MASSITLRNATAASTIFTKFLRHSATASINRLFSSSAAADGPHDPPIIVQGGPQRFKMENPFQMGGPGNVIEVDDVKGGTLVRVTLPGVGPDGFKVWAENNTVFFGGKGEIEMEGEESGRNYGGSLEFDPEINSAKDVTAEMKNGILKLLVPSAGSAQGKLKI